MNYLPEKLREQKIVKDKRNKKAGFQKPASLWRMALSY